LKNGDPLALRLYRKKQARGEATPLDDLPDVHEDGQLAWDMFTDLDRSRPRGMGISGISIVEFEAWLRVHGINDQQEIADLFDLVYSLDSVRLKEVS
jgi:hypothetical protein